MTKKFELPPLKPIADGEKPTLPDVPVLPYTIKGDLSLYFKRLGVIRPVLAVAITLILLFRFGVFSWVLSLVAILAILFGALWLVKLRKITITETGIEYRNLFLRSVQLSFTELSSAKVFINYVDPGFGTSTRLSIANTAGKQVISLQGLYWAEEPIKELASALESKKVLVEYYVEPVSYADVAREFPTHATYLELHTVKLALIASAVIILGVAAVVAVITFS